MNVLKKIGRLSDKSWALGFVRGGWQTVMEAEQWDVEWVKMPKDRWFADPFVLDVTDEEILLLVEDYDYKVRKGVISLLHINRKTMEVVSRKVLLELPTHLSFPAIWRKDGYVYVYPESAKSGKLDMYEFDTKKEELTLVKTICDDVVWDSYITEVFGEPLLFTAAKDDYQLDIYKWDDKKARFVSSQQIASEKPNSRIGGAVFEYKGDWYYPAQNCEGAYGGALDVKRISFDGVRCKVYGVQKHLESPHPTMKLGMHTLNEYKGVVVIDVHGYRYGKFGEYMDKLVALKKRLRGGKM